MALRHWSETAADNATADPNINWAEGMPPSVVNNASRAEMAAVASQYRVDAWSWCEKSSVSCSVASQTTFRLGTAWGNLTSSFHAGRRTRLTGGSTTRYGTISSASYTAETTVTITVDTGSLSASHSIVALGPAVTNSPIAKPYVADTATITANSGTFTTVAGTVRWSQIGKTVFVNVVVTITTNGTAAGYIIVSDIALPAVQGTKAACISGLNTGTGVQVRGELAAAATSMIITRYDATYSGGDGQTLILDGTYEAA